MDNLDPPPKKDNSIRKKIKDGKMAHFALSVVDLAGGVWKGWHHLILSKTVDQNCKNTTVLQCTVKTLRLFKSIC